MAVLFYKSDIDLGTNGSLLNFRIQNYTTAGRPVTTGWTGINQGYTYWDTTLSKILTWDGSGWQTAGIILSGDVVTTNAGVATIQNNSVTNAKLAQMAAKTFKGNNTAGLANALDLTATQVTAELDVFTSTLKGLTPLSGGGTANFLRADGTWAVPGGGGDMLLGTGQTVTALKTFNDGTIGLRNVANTFTALFTNTNTAARTYTLQDVTGTIAMLSNVLFIGTTSIALNRTTASQTLTGVSIDGTAAIATTSTITDDVATATTVYPTWVSGTSGNLAEKVSSTKLSFVPSTGILTATGFSGALTGTASLSTSLVGGTLGSIPYQSAAGVTAMLAPGTSTYILQCNGAAAPSWIPNTIGDMILASAQTNTGAKTFLDGTFLLRNVANTFNGVFTNTNTAARTYTLQDASGTVAFLSDITAALVGGMVNKGAYNASTNSPDLDTAPSGSIQNGWTYTVSVAGTFFSQAVQIGDVVIANQNAPTLESHWTILNKNIPDIVAASETAQGIAELATQAEVTTGTDDLRIVTPLKLRTELTGANRVYTAPSFGNGALTTFAFTHGLIGGELAPTVIITDTTSKAIIYTQVVVTSSTVVTVDFNTAPTANQYTVVIKK